MRMRPIIRVGASVALLCVIFISSARADLTGEFEKFQNCPWTNSEVGRCVYSSSEHGEVALGSRTVPIENPVVISAGVGNPNPRTRFSPLVGATNGMTMSGASQVVPGGLLNIVPKPSSPPAVRALTAILFETGILGLRATLELARPPEDIEISTNNLSQKVNTAMKLPVRVHLENPILGPNCFVGSADRPMIWELTTGKTSPPRPNRPIEGSFGTTSFPAEGLIAKIVENKLVDNSWKAPAAQGCGGPLSKLINPMVNSELGEVGAGHNAAILESTIEIITSAALKLKDS